MRLTAKMPHIRLRMEIDGLPKKGAVMSDTTRQALYEGRAGSDAPHTDLLDADDIMSVKLWSNPCWFSFRVNYIALHFNNPVYGMIEARHGLLRPDFVALYSLNLKDRTTASEIAAGSGFPKNTLSRSIQKLLKMKLIRREADPHDLRSFVLCLSEEGRAIVSHAMADMVKRERQMLAALSPAERLTLSELLGKVVLDSPNWPAVIVPTEDSPTE